MLQRRALKKHFMQIIGIGCIVAAHWLLFFESIKVSNVSVVSGLMNRGLDLSTTLMIAITGSYSISLFLVAGRLGTCAYLRVKYPLFSE